VNDLLVGRLVEMFQMGNFQGTNRLDGGTQRFIRTTVLSNILPRRPQDAENLRPIESLPFTMFAEAHR
jgi:hypothetical protein